jgi:hypothetical protein
VDREGSRGIDPQLVRLDAGEDERDRRIGPQMVRIDADENARNRSSLFRRWPGLTQMEDRTNGSPILISLHPEHLEHLRIDFFDSLRGSIDPRIVRIAAEEAEGQLETNQILLSFVHLWTNLFALLLEGRSDRS